MARTVVSFHAHPDDEALLTAGTLARAAAAGHRVVLVTATDGSGGLAADAHRQGLGSRRLAELARSASAIGAAAVHHLGYDDSGMDGSEGRPGLAFSRADTGEAADRLAALLRAEGADVLTVYDPAGGYGHPDHVAVHRVGVEAAARAGTPVVLEATVDRRPLMRVLRALDALGLPAALGGDAAEWSPARFGTAFAEPERITHRVDVRAQWQAKRAAMAAHASQAGGGEGTRTLSLFLRLPPRMFRRVFGHEWFVERGRPAPGRPLDDIFASFGSTWAGDPSPPVPGA